MFFWVSSWIDGNGVNHPTMEYEHEQRVVEHRFYIGEKSCHWDSELKKQYVGRRRDTIHIKVF
jgi:hypothetical protein